MEHYKPAGTSSTTTTVSGSSSIDFTDELASLIDTAEYFPHCPPSSYHFNTPPSAPHHAARHTPSPQQQQQKYQQRSRSRSRPPSSSEGSCPTTGSIGPARRSRRNNSVSSTSPPPPYARPHAILIPATRAGNGNGGSWFSQSSASDFSLPTPSSEHHYTPFSIPDQQKVDFGYAPPPPQIHSSPTSYHHPYSPIPPPANPPHHHHHPHPHPHHNHGPGSLAGALSPSLPLGPSTLSSAFAITPGGGGIPIPPNLANSFSVTVGLNTPAAVHPGPPHAASPTSPTGSHPPTTKAALHGAAAATTGLSQQDKQALLASEKRRRRRESHNAVERRRRDGINEKISELATLIPECMLEGATVNPTHPVPAPPNGSVSPSAEAYLTPPDGCSDPLLPSFMKKEDALVKEEMIADAAASISRRTAATSVSSVSGGAPADAGVVKANKGMILRKSVDYIRYLQQLVTAQGARNRELEQELNAYRSGSASFATNTSSPTFSSASPLSSSSGSAAAAAAAANVTSSSTQTINASPSSVMNNPKRKFSTLSTTARRKRGQGPGARTPTSDTSAEDHEHEQDESWSDPGGDFEDSSCGHHTGPGPASVGPSMAAYPTHDLDMELGGLGMGMMLGDEGGVGMDFADADRMVGSDNNNNMATMLMMMRGRRSVRRRSGRCGEVEEEAEDEVGGELENGISPLQTTTMHHQQQQQQHLGSIHPTMDSMEVDPSSSSSCSAPTNGSPNPRGRPSTRGGGGSGAVPPKPPSLSSGGMPNGMAMGIGMGLGMPVNMNKDALGPPPPAGMMHGHGFGGHPHHHHLQQQLQHQHQHGGLGVVVGMGMGMQS